MTLPAGTRLGRYEIRSQLGVGGMAEVYLAQDTQLNRSIALKILTAEVAGDPQRLHRFLQEAQNRFSALTPERRAHLRNKRGGRYSLHRDGVHPGTATG